MKSELKIDRDINSSIAISSFYKSFLRRQESGLMYSNQFLINIINEIPGIRRGMTKLCLRAELVNRSEIS
ncbi:MAG TPA: hypothetical protein DEO59_12330 [Balneola sp.]|nr:hypothetical protein [Balneola sp.]MAO77255.1 hypothetical protein [Balneola sp.]MBF63031.1 hypothetical protein [Balneola sp.]HBZ39216.1 hypothetical protein [Balneola sp.]|tara:strand:+ start:755 stop:964 length:210 start_codon:yes stop_codon:yes gene_type:complete